MFINFTFKGKVGVPDTMRRTKYWKNSQKILRKKKLVSKNCKNHWHFEVEVFERNISFQSKMIIRKELLWKENDENKQKNIFSTLSSLLKYLLIKKTSFFVELYHDFWEEPLNFDIYFQFHIYTRSTVQYLTIVLIATWHFSWGLYLMEYSTVQWENEFQE